MRLPALAAATAVRTTHLSAAGAARALSAATSLASSSAQRSSRGILKPSRTPLARRTPRRFSSTLESSSIASDAVPTSSLISYTTLPNRVRVATEATPGHFSAAGVYVDAGSRFERTGVPGESGVSHLLDRMAFKSTANRTEDQMTQEMNALGGNLMCSSSRETMMYQSSMFNQDVPAVVSLLADTILHPALLATELDAQREAAAWEISEIWNKPEMILPELLHTIAYGGKTLGNPLLCPLESLEQMTVDNLRDFMHTWYAPERIVVAGAGMPHEQLVELAEKHFGGLQPRLAVEGAEARSASPSSRSSSSASSSQSSLFSRASSASSATTAPSADFSTAAAAAAQHASNTLSSLRPDVAGERAAYVGGEYYEARPDLEFTHVYVAFEGLSIHDEDLYALAVLQILLGGGGSFSAGGPGKGMYSRLYTNVLNQHHAVDFCAAFHHCYADSGLFGIAASVHPNFNGHVGNLIAHELELCTSPHMRGAVTERELARARNQLKSSLVMALESRLIEVEDLGRQVQVHGHKVSVEEMCARIDEVDVARLHRVANRVLRPQSGGKALNFGLGNGQATVVAQGSLDGLGDIREILQRRGLGNPPTKQPEL